MSRIDVMVPEDAPTGIATVGIIINSSSKVFRLGSPGVTMVVESPPATPPCTYTLSPGNQALPATGGSGSISVTAPVGCSWSVWNRPTWIAFTSATSGTGNGVVTFSVSANFGSSLRGSVTIERTTVAIEQAALSTPGLTFVGAMPHIAAQDVWTTTFTLVNKSATPATAGLNLFSDQAGPLTLPLVFPQQPSTPIPLPGILPQPPKPGPEFLAASFDRIIPANASLIVATAGPQTPPVQIGSAQLSATGSIDGFAIFRLIPGSQEAVVPLETRNASSYVLAFDNTGGVVLGVAVHNVANNFASIPIVIRDDTGAVISPPFTAYSLPANGHTSFVLSQQYPFTANKRGTIEFTTPSGGRISVLGIRTTPLTTSTGTNTLTLTTVPALADVGTNGGSIAHIATGAGWQTTFVLVNTDATAAQATLKFFATGTGTPLSIPLTFPQTGSSNTANSVTQTIAAGATLIVQSTAPASDPAPIIGSAQLTATGNIGGFVIFRYNPNGQEAVVPLENRIASGYLIAFDNTSGTATGIAVNSIAAQDINVPVIVRDDAGNQIATDTLTLAANGHTAFTLGVDKFCSAPGSLDTTLFTLLSPGSARAGPGPVSGNPALPSTIAGCTF